MMEVVLSLVLAVFTGGLAYATWQLVVVNQGLLRETKKAADAATTSANAATSAAKTAGDNAQLAKREFLLAHRSYVRPDNFKASWHNNSGQVRISFDVRDVAGVPTYVHGARTRVWVGDGTEMPDTKLHDSHIILDVYRDYLETVNVWFPLPVKLSSSLKISMYIEIDYTDSASRERETWSGTVSFRYDDSEKTFTPKLFKGGRHNN